MPLTEWSLRISDGWPEDSAQDVAGSAWAGRVDFGDRPVTVRAAPDLRAGIPTPDSLTDLHASH